MTDDQTAAIERLRNIAGLRVAMNGLPANRVIVPISDLAAMLTALDERTAERATLDLGEGETWLTPEQEQARTLNGALQILTDPTSSERHEHAAAECIKRLFVSLTAERDALTPDKIGETVRDAWVKWAETQPSPKAHWLTPWADLNERDREADRQIGLAVARLVLAARASQTEGT